jgi:hypothetical protein
MWILYKLCVFVRTLVGIPVEPENKNEEHKETLQLCNTNCWSPSFNCFAFYPFLVPATLAKTFSTAPEHPPQVIST